MAGSLTSAEAHLHHPHLHSFSTHALGAHNQGLHVCGTQHLAHPKLPAHPKLTRCSQCQVRIRFSGSAPLYSPMEPRSNRGEVFGHIQAATRAQRQGASKDCAWEEHGTLRLQAS